MKWNKLGSIFRPEAHKVSGEPLSFAQSPQTLVFDDFVRIYFSTRKRDPINNKFFSHIAYVDMDKSFNVQAVSEHEVIPLGELGTFDEHGIFPINILKKDDQLFAYTCGWSRRKSVSVETSTGFAFSKDNGKTFQKVGHGPVFSSSLYEPLLVGDSFVKHYDGLFHMWYIYGTKWIESDGVEPPARVYKIAHATSIDNVNWKRDGKQIIADELNADECQALPTVLKVGNRYHMYFCFREAKDFRTNPKNGYRLGYAYSDDLIRWTRDDAHSGIGLGPTTAWDADMMCYPHIFEWHGNVYLLYNGNEFGKFGFGIAQLETAES